MKRPSALAAVAAAVQAAVAATAQAAAAAQATARSQAAFAAAAQAAVAAALLACGHADRPPHEPTAGSGSAAGNVHGGPCDAVRGRVEQLYRAEAKGAEPARQIADEVVADNTAMVMADCAQAPEKTAACITAATSVKDLEARCLVPIDDEGTEGDKLAR